MLEVAADCDGGNGSGIASDPSQHLAAVTCFRMMATVEDEFFGAGTTNRSTTPGLRHGYHRARLALLARQLALMPHDARGGSRDRVAVESRRDAYLVMRRRLLEQQYRKRVPTSLANTRLSMDETTSTSTSGSTTPKSSAGESPRRDQGSGIRRQARKVTDVYAFTGMHHLFDHHRKAVTRVVFAHENKDLLALGAADGTISVCMAYADPRVLHTLRGHSAAVTDLEWGITNDVLLSCSEDATCRLWNPESGACMRVLRTEAANTSVAFVPTNNNLFLIAQRRWCLRLTNVSTGRCEQRIRHLGCRGDATSVVFDNAGKLAFAADSVGNVRCYAYDGMRHQLSLLRKVDVSPNGSALHSLAFKGWYRRGRFMPELLCACVDGTVKLFGWNAAARTLVPRRAFRTRATAVAARATFCPLIPSGRDGVCIVSGAQDASVLIFDVTRRRKPCINKLQGHGAPVIDVAWNYDESLLASADQSGLVILWKRIVVVKDADREGAAAAHGESTTNE